MNLSRLELTRRRFDQSRVRPSTPLPPTPLPIHLQFQRSSCIDRLNFFKMKANLLLNAAATVGVDKTFWEAFNRCISVKRFLVWQSWCCLRLGSLFYQLLLFSGLCQSACNWRIGVHAHIDADTESTHTHTHTHTLAVTMRARTHDAACAHARTWRMVHNHCGTCERARSLSANWYTINVFRAFSVVLTLFRCPLQPRVTTAGKHAVDSKWCKTFGALFLMRLPPEWHTVEATAAD